VLNIYDIVVKAFFEFLQIFTEVISFIAVFKENFWMYVKSVHWEYKQKHFIFIRKNNIFKI
jgi:hypothetical protein